jgi:hypothetical protein
MPRDAIVMDFYRRSCAEMQPKIEAALERPSGLKHRLHALIRPELLYFAPAPEVLRTLFRNGVDSKNQLSPFSPQNEGDPRHCLVSPHTTRLWRTDSFRARVSPAGVLWFFQMDVVFSWVISMSRRIKPGRISY